MTQDEERQTIILTLRRARRYLDIVVNACGIDDDANTLLATVRELITDATTSLEQ